jgi:hypothetical protein
MFRDTLEVDLKELYGAIVIRQISFIGMERPKKVKITS